MGFPLVLGLGFRTPATVGLQGGGEGWGVVAQGDGLRDGGGVGGGAGGARARERVERGDNICAHTHPDTTAVLQSFVVVYYWEDLLQSCSGGGRRGVEDMCCEELYVRQPYPSESGPNYPPRFRSRQKIWSTLVFFWIFFETKDSFGREVLRRLLKIRLPIHLA